MTSTGSGRGKSNNVHIDYYSLAAAPTMSVSNFAQKHFKFNSPPNNLYAVDAFITRGVILATLDHLPQEAVSRLVDSTPIHRNLDKIDVLNITPQHLMTASGPYFQLLENELVAWRDDFAEQFGFQNLGNKSKPVYTWQYYYASRPYVTEPSSSGHVRQLVSILRANQEKIALNKAIVHASLLLLDKVFPRKLDSCNKFLKSIFTACGFPTLPFCLGGVYRKSGIQSLRDQKDHITSQLKLHHDEFSAEITSKERQEQRRRKSAGLETTRTSKLAQTFHPDMLKTLVNNTRHAMIMRMIWREDEKPQDVTKSLWNKLKSRLFLWQRHPILLVDGAVKERKLWWKAKLKGMQSLNASQQSKLASFLETRHSHSLMQQRAEEKKRRKARGRHTYQALLEINPIVKFECWEVPRRTCKSIFTSVSEYARRLASMFESKKDSFITAITDIDIAAMKGALNNALEQTEDVIIMLFKAISGAINEVLGPAGIALIYTLVGAYLMFQLPNNTSRTVFAGMFLIPSLAPNVHKAFKNFFDSIKEMWNDFRMEQSGDSVSFFSAYGNIWNSIMGNKIPDEVVKESANTLKSFNLFVAASRGIGSFLSVFAKFLEGMLEGCKERFAFWNDPQHLSAREWTKQAAELANKHRNGVESDAEAVHVLHVWNYGLRTITELNKQEGWLHTKLTSLMTHLKPAYSLSNQRLLSGTPRQQPLFLFMYGAAGVGKSTLSKAMINSLHSAFQGNEYTDSPESLPASSVYTWGPEDNFMDSYNNQWAVIADDVFMQDDKKLSGERVSTMCSMINTAPFSVPCADLNLKGTKYFRSEFIICTNNLPNVVPTGVVDEDPFKRRRTIFVEVVKLREDQPINFVTNTHFVIKNTFTEAVVATMELQEFFRYCHFVMANRNTLSPPVAQCATLADIMSFQAPVVQHNELFERFTKIFKDAQTPVMNPHVYRRRMEQSLVYCDECRSPVALCRCKSCNRCKLTDCCDCVPICRDCKYVEEECRCFSQQPSLRESPSFIGHCTGCYLPTEECECARLEEFRARNMERVLKEVEKLNRESTSEPDIKPSVFTRMKNKLFAPKIHIPDLVSDTPYESLGTPEYDNTMLKCCVGAITALTTVVGAVMLYKHFFPSAQPTTEVRMEETVLPQREEQAKYSNDLPRYRANAPGRRAGTEKATVHTFPKRTEQSKRMEQSLVMVDNRAQLCDKVPHIEVLNKDQVRIGSMYGLIVAEGQVLVPRHLRRLLTLPQADYIAFDLVNKGENVRVIIPITDISMSCHPTKDIGLITFNNRKHDHLISGKRMYSKFFTEAQLRSIKGLFENIYRFNPEYNSFDKLSEAYPVRTSIYTDSNDTVGTELTGIEGYLVQTKNGDCGLPYTLAINVHDSKFILGIHISGVEGQGLGMFSTVTWEDFNILLKANTPEA
uniref:SF3 helicase domain-containing protein n=1 Tax=Riboviria sp. TaxID=2585031 RepID=A0A8K1HIX0_9VIRU|nr:hypothetical protein 1 [Riboviria sp.]